MAKTTKRKKIPDEVLMRSWIFGSMAVGHSMDYEHGKMLYERDKKFSRAMRKSIQVVLDWLEGE